jgi:membrane protein DedA with SNARE-associated domain
VFSRLNVNDLVTAYGCWAVLVAVAVNSSGIPFPANPILIAAALYAGTTHQLQIAWVIAAAAGGAVAGYGVSYLVGYLGGHRLLVRHGRRVGLDERRLRLGRYVFARFGGRFLVVARFVELAHTYAALMAGGFRMPWRSFLVFNVVGGVGWAAAVGLAAYLMGGAINRVAGPAGLVLAIAGAVALIGFLRFLRRNVRQLELEAERFSSSGPPA